MHRSRITNSVKTEYGVFIGYTIYKHIQIQYVHIYYIYNICNNPAHSFNVMVAIDIFFSFYLKNRVVAKMYLFLLCNILYIYTCISFKNEYVGRGIPFRIVKLMAISVILSTFMHFYIFNSNGG